MHLQLTGARHKNTNKSYPLNWANFILSAPNKNSYNIDNVLEALSILRGEYVENGKTLNDRGISLFHFLKNLGIDVSDIDIDTVVPNVTEEKIYNLMQMNPGMTELDALNILFTSEQRKNILTIIRAMKYITNGKYGYAPGKDLVQYNSKNYGQIGSSLPITSEGITQASYLFQGAQRFSYTPASYLNKLIDIFASFKNINNMNDEEYAAARAQMLETIEKEFGQYDFFKDKDGNWNNIWLKMLTDENSDFAEQIAILDILGVKGGRNNAISIQDSREELLESLFYSFLNYTKDGKYAYYRTMPFSDTDAMVLIKGPAFTSGENWKEDIISNLTTVLKQEIERIQAARKASDPNSNIRQGSKIDRYDKNAFKFCNLPYFERYKDELLEEYYTTDYDRTSEVLEKWIDKMMDENFYSFINNLSSEQYQEFYKNIRRIFDNISTEHTNEQHEDAEEDVEEGLIPFAEENTEDKTSQEVIRETVNYYLEQFYYNDFFAQTQLNQLLFGDLAYAKNYDDAIKRNKQSYAAGEAIYSLDENGEQIYDTAIFLDDIEEIAPSYDKIEQLIDSTNQSETDKAVARGIMYMWKKSITTTDGQSLRTLKSFKKIMQAAGGKWNEGLERSYNNIISGNFNAEDLNILVNSAKPFVFTHESREVNGRNERVNLQYKNSEYVLSAIYGALSCALTQSPVLIGLHKFMDAHDIDIVHFHSSVKVGFNNPFNLSEVVNDAQDAVASLRQQIQETKAEIAQLEEGITERYIEGINPNKTQRLNTKLKELENSLDEALEDVSNTVKGVLESQYEEMGENALHKTPLSDYMTMQPNDDHLLDTEAVFPSQLRNIICADLPADFTITVNLGGSEKTLNRDEAVKFYNTLIADQLLDNFKLLNYRFSNIKALQQYLLQQARQNPRYGQDVINALQLNEEGTAFRLPFNSPNLSNKIEELLYSSFKNYITRQKINGGAAVLVSNFGLSKDLHIQWKEDGSIDYIPCYLPATMRKQLQDFLVEREKDGRTWYELDFEKLKANSDPELLDLIGTRIPTENKYSIMKLRVQGFMPISMGTQIMLPHEIIKMSGTDFDIDKLFLMLKNLRRERIDAQALYTHFNKYINDNHIELTEAEQKAMDRFFNLKNLYSGLTVEELRSLEKEIPDLENFVEEGDGYYDYYKYPQYKVLKVRGSHNKNLDDLSKLSEIKDLKLRLKLRDNMLINMIGGILSTPAGSRQSLTPGNFENLSKWSTAMRILNDKMALQAFITQNGREFLKAVSSMSLEELDNFYERYSVVKDPNDIMQFIDTHNNLMDGNALIGATANISSTHFKYQFIDLEINKNNQFYIRPYGSKQDIKITKLDSVRSPINGKLISDIIAEAQAAAPDNGKDPRLGYLGFTLKGIALPATLMRMGLDYNTISIILNSTPLVNMGKNFTEYIQGKENTVLLKFSPNINRIADLLIKIKLEEDLDDSDLEYIASYSIWYENLNKIKTDVNKAKAISKRDSPNNALGNNTAKILQEELEAEDFMKQATSPLFTVKGLDKLVTTHLDISSMSEEELRNKIMEAPIPRYQAFYTLGIDSAMSLAGKYIPALQLNTYKAVKMLREQMGLPLTYESNLSTIKLFVSELPAFFLSKNSIFASDDNMTFEEKRNYYINSFPTKMKAFLKQNDKKGSNDMNKLRNLNIIKNLNISSKTGIILRGTSVKTSPRNRIKMQQELESIVFSSNPEIAQFGADLVNYAYYNSGLNFGMSNYSNYLSTVILEWIPTVMDRLIVGNAEWSNDHNGDLLDNYVKQFLLNHPSYIPLIKGRKGQLNYEVREGENNTKQIKFPKQALVYKYGRVSSLVDFVKFKNKVYRKIPNIDLNGHERVTDTWYEECSVNTYKDAWGYTPFYDMSKDATEMDFTGMKERGKTGKVFHTKEGLTAIAQNDTNQEDINQAESNSKEKAMVNSLDKKADKENVNTKEQVFLSNTNNEEGELDSKEQAFLNQTNEAQGLTEAESALLKKMDTMQEKDLKLEEDAAGIANRFQQLYESNYASQEDAFNKLEKKEKNKSLQDFKDTEEDPICKI